MRGEKPETCLLLIHPNRIYPIQSLSIEELHLLQFFDNLKEKTGNENATSLIIQAISMTVKRGNATSIMGTLGPLIKLEDNFDIISPRGEKS